MVFDPIYGYIAINQLEWELIHTPYYQRLRWIKQLGFSGHVFYGAEHSRFGHSLGVMHNAHCIMEICHLTVSEEELFTDRSKLDNKFLGLSKERIEKLLFHQSLRVAALLHDIGAFPFSHTTEEAYIDFGKKNQSKKKSVQDEEKHDDHEHLGSVIIKDTDFVNGITFILKKHGLNPQKISLLVTGKDPSKLSNQILHSEIDCDRMDYLLRDAHYTGLKYGTYDRAYLLHHFRVVHVGDEPVLAINLNALHCVEDFLMARFAWYSQVIRSPRGAKFDAIAEEICYFFLTKNKIYSYEKLFDLVKTNPLEFYQFHDGYFIQKIQQGLVNGEFKKNEKIQELSEMLLFERSPKTVKCEEFEQKLIMQNDPHDLDKVLKKVHEKIHEIELCIKKKGSSKDWIVVDLPTKNVLFTKSFQKIVKHKSYDNLLLERDPVKIFFPDGEVKLLVEVDQSIISKIQNLVNFIPNVFCSESTQELLRREGLSK